MRKFLCIIALLAAVACYANPEATPPAGWWRVSLQRADARSIDFNIEIQYKNGKPVWYVRNATERMAITSIQQEQDSIWVQMPLFESGFRLKYERPAMLRGEWIKGTAGATQVMPVTFTYNESKRYPQANKRPAFTVTGRWAATFVDNSNNALQAIAEFKQNGNALSGSILTPTGDYRYLEGAVSNDTLQLSTFDGSHAYYFTAIIHNDSVLTNGLFCSGATYVEHWTAKKDPGASVPDTLAAVYLKPGEDRLHFRFPDLDSNMISINDARFKNKVVIIQLMGSWCPNCMDETAFLIDYYNKNKQRGIEMVALAYEYSTDFHRSQKSLRKFQQHFNIQYPMLITGVRVGDSLRTEKTLPQITRIRMFPTTLFLGRDGKVKKINTGFVGPGTGAHYEAFKKEFYGTVDELLKGSL